MTISSLKLIRLQGRLSRRDTLLIIACHLGFLEHQELGAYLLRVTLSVNLVLSRL